MYTKLGTLLTMILTLCAAEIVEELLPLEDEEYRNCCAIWESVGDAHEARVGFKAMVANYEHKYAQNACCLLLNGTDEDIEFVLGHLRIMQGGSNKNLAVCASNLLVGCGKTEDCEVAIGCLKKFAEDEDITISSLAVYELLIRQDVSLVKALFIASMAFDHDNNFVKLAGAKLLIELIKRKEDVFADSISFIEDEGESDLVESVGEQSLIDFRKKFDAEMDGSLEDIRKNLRVLVGKPDLEIYSDALSMLIECGVDEDLALVSPILQRMLANPMSPEAGIALFHLNGRTIVNREKICDIARARLVNPRVRSWFDATILVDSPGDQDYALAAYREFLNSQNIHNAFFAAAYLFDCGSEEDKGKAINVLQQIIKNLHFLHNSFVVGILFCSEDQAVHALARKHIKTVLKEQKGSEHLRNHYHGLC